MSDTVHTFTDVELAEHDRQVAKQAVADHALLLAAWLRDRYEGRDHDRADDRPAAAGGV